MALGIRHEMSCIPTWNGSNYSNACRIIDLLICTFYNEMTHTVDYLNLWEPIFVDCEDFLLLGCNFMGFCALENCVFCCGLKLMGYRYP